ncbi:hypothetical protein [Celerinatantimonas sp. MCCC 1A17872]|uniref:hypothetical protein n=1 Tax=Celerinatantimonas sp. MCCC 1A17872 TaxID=3177514 RepID=UPI0038C0E6A7
MNQYMVQIAAIEVQMIDPEDDLLPMRKAIANVLKKAHQKLSAGAFAKLLDQAIPALVKYCGCAEDFEKLEHVLDDLYDHQVIDSKGYQDIESHSACNRWL